MPEPTAQPTPVQVEQGMRNLFATQFLGASDAAEVADEEVTEATDEIGAEATEIAEGEEVIEDDPDAEQAASDFLLDLKVNGKEHRITDRSEAIRLAQLGLSSTERYEEASRRESQAQEREATATQARDLYAALLPELEAYLANPIGETPRRDAFPDELSYLKADKAHNEALAGIQKIRAERQRIQREQEGERAKALERWAREQDHALLAELPEWHDPAVRDAEWKAMMAYALTKGAKPEAFNNPLLAFDKPFRLILRDAMRFQQVQAKGATEVKRVQTQVAAPGAKPVAGEAVSRRRKEIEQRATSGKTADVAEAMTHLLSRKFELDKQPKRTIKR